MHHGFIKVASATPALQVAGCAYNTEQLLALMAQAGLDEPALRWREKNTVVMTARRRDEDA